MSEQLNAFMEAVKVDERLQEKLKVAEDAVAVVAIAKEAGFAISMEVVQKIEEQLSDDDLENVTGGIKGNGMNTQKTCNTYQKCYDLIREQEAAKTLGWNGTEDFFKWKQNRL